MQGRRLTTKTIAKRGDKIPFPAFSVKPWHKGTL